MGSKANYTQLIADREEVQKRTATLINAQLSRISYVASRVLTKKFGYGWMKEDISFLGPLGFLAKHGVSVRELTETHIKIHVPAAENRLPKGILEVPVEFIRMSDWEIGSNLRKKIYERKAYLKNLDVSNAANEIKKVEQTIASHNKELERLRNLLNQKEKLSKAARKKTEQ